MLRFWALNASEFIFIYCLWTNSKKQNNHYSIRFFWRLEITARIMCHEDVPCSIIHPIKTIFKKKKLLRNPRTIAPPVLPWVPPFCWWHHLTPWPWDVEKRGPSLDGDPGCKMADLPIYEHIYVYTYHIYIAHIYMSFTRKNNTTNPGDTKNV